MPFACHRHSLASAAILLFSFVTSSTITSHPEPSPIADLTTCEFRTINYITDSLPQLCFKNSWTADAPRTPLGEGIGGGESVAVAGISASHNSTLEQQTTQSETASPSPTTESVTSTSQTSPIASSESLDIEEEASELDESSFLSFEDWKRQALEKTAQQNAHIAGKKSSGENRRKDLDHSPDSFGPFGEEGEIDIDFGVFRRSGSENEASKTAEDKTSQTADQPIELEKTEKRNEHRSKDAGKTCKERFSYASFDAGATVLKTHQGAKNAKSVLIENKDSYMLSVCSTENKFIIIELSEEILIDTVVLANYEFFSSMIRTFRVSVSDRYPVKMEKWKELGVYEARNSRDIQAFLIENPQIWARYIRIEFLSHFGNEYYCPLSLVRVHGTRMLESWKESEAIGEDDDPEEGEEDEPETRYEPEAVAEVVKEEERRHKELRKAAEEVVKKAHDDAVEKAKAAKREFLENGTSPWVKFSFSSTITENATRNQQLCLPVDALKEQQSATSEPLETSSKSSTQPSTESAGITFEAETSSDKPTTAQIPSTKESASQFASTATSMESNITSSSSAFSDSVTATSSQQVTFQPSKTQVTSGSQKNKTSHTASAPSSLPTVQESFFKAVSRRLQLLETNSTLSLKYIEEQSKILREAFSKVEKKQSQKSTSFLNTLNSTVLAELRGFRQQYDQIWQSTIISLETQRDESRREIIAISARLNILADEVVFQKRMSIVQSIVLLLCLGLVIFSRVSATGQVEFSNLQSRFRNFGAESPLRSPALSPSFRRMDSMRSDRSWEESGHSRIQSGEYEGGISRSGSFRNGSQSPTSFYSRSEYNLTPPSGPEEIPLGIPDDSLEPRPDHLEPPRPQSHRRVSGLASGQESPSLPPSTQTSPAKTARKQENSFRQVASPPTTNTSSLETTPQPESLSLNFPNRPQMDLAFVSTPLPTVEDLSSPEADDEYDDEKPASSNFHIARKPLPALPPKYP